MSGRCCICGTECENGLKLHLTTSHAKLVANAVSWPDANDLNAWILNAIRPKMKIVFTGNGQRQSNGRFRHLSPREMVDFTLHKAATSTFVYPRTPLLPPSSATAVHSSQSSSHFVRRATSFVPWSTRIISSTAIPTARTSEHEYSSKKDAQTMRTDDDGDKKKRHLVALRCRRIRSLNLVAIRCRRPQKPPSLQCLFHREFLKSSNVHRTSRESVLAWRQLDTKEKDRYIFLHSQEMATYTKNLVAWEKQMIHEGQEELVEAMRKLENRGPAIEMDSVTSSSSVARIHRNTPNKKAKTISQKRKIAKKKLVTEGQSNFEAMHEIESGAVESSALSSSNLAGSTASFHKEISFENDTQSLADNEVISDCVPSTLLCNGSIAHATELMADGKTRPLPLEDSSLVTCATVSRTVQLNGEADPIIIPSAAQLNTALTLIKPELEQKMRDTPEKGKARMIKQKLPMKEDDVITNIAIGHRSLMEQEEFSRTMESLDIVEWLKEEVDELRFGCWHELP